MIVGYNLTSMGREFFRMIQAAVEDRGEATATMLTILHSHDFFEPVEFTAKTFGEHIDMLIAGEAQPYSCEFDTRDMQEIIREIGSKMYCTVTFDYERELVRFATNNQFLNREYFEMPALPDILAMPPSFIEGVRVRAIGFSRLHPRFEFSCGDCGEIIPASIRRLSAHAKTHALK